MRAAIYARYSSENQREASLEDQERLCRQEADRLGYTVTKVYQDAALSGQLNEDQRPGFQAMLVDAKSKAFDVLIVDDASRLSRDTADALRVLKRLEFWGVGFVARADGIDTTTNGKGSRLLYGIKSAMNEEFIRDLAAKTHRGLEGRARNGFSPGGLPYGYRSEPVYDAERRIIGYKKVVFEPEAEIVRRIFRLYVGDEDSKPCSSRTIVRMLNREGIAPPGARWKNKTVRQATTWSYTCIIGHRRLGKGILNNRLYIGKAAWNRSQWQRDPDSKKYRYRVRPAEEWVEVDIPELRIVPQDLWERAQKRVVVAAMTNGAESKRGIGKYLLSGFLRCGVCGGSYIKTNQGYRCGNHRNRGPEVCTNRRGVTVEKLDRSVIAAIRTKLYTPENLGKIIEYVRDELMVLARQEAKADRDVPDQAKALRDVEREIENIKAAVKLGKATESLLTMLEDAERRRKALVAGREVPRRDDVQARLERVLRGLPARVQACLADLERLLSVEQVAHGRAILGSLVSEIRIHPDGTADISGDLHGVLSLVSRDRDFTRWLGEEDSNPR